MVAVSNYDSNWEDDLEHQSLATIQQRFQEVQALESSTFKIYQQMEDGDNLLKQCSLDAVLKQMDTILCRKLEANLATSTEQFEIIFHLFQQEKQRALPPSPMLYITSNDIFQMEMLYKEIEKKSNLFATT